jgi:hypothetical protein
MSLFDVASRLEDDKTRLRGGENTHETKSSSHLGPFDRTSSEARLLWDFSLSDVVDRMRVHVLDLLGSE